MILQDRVAIVTAAGSGIGRGGAEIMGREGAVVIATDLVAARAEETAQRIRAAGGRAEALALDVTDDAAIESLIADVARRHGRLDILHNHAGIQVEGSLEQVPAKGLDDSYKINVRAHFVAAKAALPHMKRQGKGVILNTSSNSGVFFDKGMLAYITSKTAVIAMTRQMALDYGPHNIRVNALCPGWVDTPFNDPYIRQMGGRGAIDAYVKEKIPMGRWASVDEIAESILFLASDRSSYMTGHALVIDGGESIA
ncbi:MAG TPA: glucose 1-dehydrogenase [Alphaproteobacteria bacterium]|nr:glucose 1-dehydrogenase [Alphaproteobacteria bacterium]